MLSRIRRVVRVDLGSHRAADDASDVISFDDLRGLRQDFTRFMLRHRFGMEEIVTKLHILRDEFALMHETNPIEHVASRLKSPDSLAEKIERKGCEASWESISAAITDIAGVRVTCSFVSDVYQVFDVLTSQHDVTLREVRDYIVEPKPNGYRSLHALVEVPVYLSDGPVAVGVEVQMRTIAMDFWASLEHKIHYKYRGAVPADLQDRLREAAESANALDGRMESLHAEVRGLDESGVTDLSDDLRAELRGGDDLVPSERLMQELRRLADGDDA